MTWLVLLFGCVAERAGEGPSVLPSFPDAPSPDPAPPRDWPALDAVHPEPARRIGDRPLDAADHPGVAPFPNVDVLIIGAGPAGLAAALEAVTAGASVAVLERESTYGGAANWAGALMLFSGTARQTALGITDSPEQLLSEWESFTGGDPDDPWVQAFAHRNVDDVHEWLRALGVSFTDPAGDSSSGTTLRIHSVAGGGPALVSAIEAPLDGDVILYESEATALVQDRDGRVIGVQWRDRALDEAHFARADTVIVATGGFQWDLERVRAERPDLYPKELRRGAWPGADGNGLAMVEALGGATENLDVVGLYAHGTDSPTPLDELRAVTFAQVPWINDAGVRFVDEADTNGFGTGEVRAAEDDVWAIMDAPTAEAHTFDPNEPGGASYTIADLLAAGIVTSADSLAELAAAVGVDAATMEAEIQGFNDAAAGLAPDPWRLGTVGMEPVLVGPYYAVPVAIAVSKAFGGVDVDTSGRVLDTDGAPIPGLYAAGELTGMAGGTLVGERGFTGSLTAVILGGRIAGAAAAAEVVYPASWVSR